MPDNTHKIEYVLISLQLIISVQFYVLTKFHTCKSILYLCT